ncbi:DUF4105 domain-containing protein [Terriglobus roseus]|uniref:DUF4105 domain-containing protein n=1 Tax=Terriglobus roseus TaxID=392734 RepID=UPI0003156A28|nr:DUF4105 domain-containing protein [Terriglobus roseus]
MNEAPSRPLWRASILLSLTLAFVSWQSARASLAVLVGEPFGSFGTMMPLGHTAIYLNHVCADGPLKVRLCRPDEPQGVVLARYHAIGQYDWLATPIMDFLYATHDPAEVLAFATPQKVWAMRERYRERFLREVVPDGKQGTMNGDGSAKHAHDLDEWWETAGMAYQRRLWAYEVSTTPEQDATLVAVMNDQANRHRYHLSGANCADFAAELLNLYYPGAVRHADRIADYGLMTPKHVVRSLTGYAEKHPELDMHVWEIAQIPGSLRRSKTVWGGVESALKTKRYLFTLLVIQPEVPLVLEALYLRHGRWKLGQGAQPMPPLMQTGPEETVAATPTALEPAGSE